MKNFMLLTCGVLLSLSSLAWVNCDVQLYSLSLPRGEQLQSTHRTIDVAKDLADRTGKRFSEIVHDAGTREICVKLGISNDFERVNSDTRAINEALIKLINDLHALELRLKEVERLRLQKRDRKVEESVISRMKGIVIPKLDFGPDATIVEALEFFRKNCSSDAPDGGFSFIFRDSCKACEADGERTVKARDSEDPKSVPVSKRVIPKIDVADVSFYDAMTIVCESVGCQWEVSNGCIIVTEGGLGE